MNAKLPENQRLSWDDDARIAALLACHPTTVPDPERAWAAAGGHHGLASALGILANRGLARLLGAAAVLALAGRPAEVGWLDLDEPRSPEPDDERGEGENWEDDADAA